MPTKPELVLLLRCNFSFVACYSLKFTCCSLLPVKSLVTRCKILSLLVAEVARCKKTILTRYRSCSLQKITCSSLQNLLVTRCRSCSLQKNHLLLVAKFARCLLQKWSHFLQLYEKVTPPQVLSCEFLRNYKSTYSLEHLRTAASENNSKASTNFLQFLRQVFHFDLSLIELLLNCLIKLN